jgi:VanZ family protein
MQRLIRVACVGYVVFLTLLLLTSNPAMWIGCRGGHLPAFVRSVMPEAHLLSFLVLAMLMLASRWPVPQWGVLLLLAIYGGATEIIQGFIPPRTPELADWLQDMGGLALGTAVCWALVFVGRISLARLSEHFATPHILSQLRWQSPQTPTVVAADNEPSRCP